MRAADVRCKSQASLGCCRPLLHSTQALIFLHADRPRQPLQFPTQQPKRRKTLTYGTTSTPKQRMRASTDGRLQDRSCKKKNAHLVVGAGVSHDQKAGLLEGAGDLVGEGAGGEAAGDGVGASVGGELEDGALQDGGGSRVGESERQVQMKCVQCFTGACFPVAVLGPAVLPRSSATPASIVGNNDPPLFCAREPLWQS